MSRSVAWRRVISDTASWRQDEANNATIYILREIGPTGFLLKEDGERKKFKVLLGDPHSCTCPVFMKEKDICKHICWVLLKKFRIPRTNPVTWQLGLVEREINEILRGILAKQRPKTTVSKPTVSGTQEIDGRPVLEQREISEDDVCPICQDELLEKKEAVTYCKFGCGNSVHIKCMKVWAEHQKTQGKTNVECPFCREDFGPIEILRKEYATANTRTTRSEKVDLHLGVTCDVCQVCPIVGKCFKCNMCNNSHMCQQCYSAGGNHPPNHTFVFRQKCTQRWRTAVKPSGMALPQAVVNNLMTRDISDNDYDMLLQLDNPSSSQPSNIPEEVIQNLPTERVKEGGRLLAPGEQCRVCLRSYSVGQYVKRLPCRHRFHKDCIDNWLLHEHATCPLDGQMVWNPVTAQLVSDRPRQRVTNQQQNQPPAATSEQPSLQLEIPGIGVAQMNGGAQSIQRRGILPRGKLQQQGAVSPADGSTLQPGFALSGTAINSTNTEAAPSIMNSPLRMGHVTLSKRPPVAQRGIHDSSPVAPSIPLPRNETLVVGTGRNSAPSSRLNAQRSDSDNETGRRKGRAGLQQGVRRARSSSASRANRSTPTAPDLHIGDVNSEIAVPLASVIPQRKLPNSTTKRTIKPSSTTKRTNTQHVPIGDIALTGSQMSQLTLQDCYDVT